MGKVSLFSVAKEYLGTLTSYRTKKPMIGDILVQLVLPGLFAAWLTVGKPVEASVIAAIADKAVVGVSIISALLCGVAVMMFQLRVQMSTSEDFRPTERESALVDHTFHDLLWAVVAGFASVILSIVSSAFGIDSVWRAAVYGLMAFFFVNFVLVTCMCIKRISKTYVTVSSRWGNRQ